MSSYKQREIAMPIATALHDAVQELRWLADDMGNLCASIEAQFPDRYESIAKYGQALRAFEALQSAVETAEGNDFESLHLSLSPAAKITITVGQQMRQGRETSQRVRLGNARVRLAGVLGYLEEQESLPDAIDALRQMLAELEGVTFPTTHG